MCSDALRLSSHLKCTFRDERCNGQGLTVLSIFPLYAILLHSMDSWTDEMILLLDTKAPYVVPAATKDHYKSTDYAFMNMQEDPQGAAGRWRGEQKITFPLLHSWSQETTAPESLIAND